jgi:hypothetical protein
MHRVLRTLNALFISTSLSLATAGCAPEPAGTATPNATPGADSNRNEYQAVDLKIGIGEYMPPLENGNLEIASPEGWDWARPGGDYLVGFVPRGSDMNSLPRILVSADDPPYPDFQRVTKDNMGEFAKAVSDSLADQKLAEPAQALLLGENPFCRTVTFAKRKNAVVSRQILETVVAGRRYTVTLEVYERQFDKYRDAAYAVAMSMRFESPGES